MPSPETSPTGQIVDYVLSTRTADIPANVRKEGLRSFFNILGCTVGGARHAAVGTTWAALAPFAGEQQVTLIGRGLTSDSRANEYRQEYSEERRVIKANMEVSVLV